MVQSCPQSSQMNVVGFQTRYREEAKENLSPDSAQKWNRMCPCWGISLARG